MDWKQLFEPQRKDKRLKKNGKWAKWSTVLAHTKTKRMTTKKQLIVPFSIVVVSTLKEQTKGGTLSEQVKRNPCIERRKNRKKMAIQNVVFLCTTNIAMTSTVNE